MATPVQGEQPVQHDEYRIPRQHAPWTLAEWLELPPGRPHIELVDGMLVMSPASRAGNGRLMTKLWRQLADAAPAGLEAMPELNVGLGGDRALIPDFCIIDRPGFDAVIVPARHVVLVGEIASPSTRVYDRTTKRALYAEAGIPYLMLVDPGEPPIATLLELHGAEYIETARSTGGQLELRRPFTATLDLGQPAPTRS